MGRSVDPVSEDPISADQEQVPGGGGHLGSLSTAIRLLPGEIRTPGHRRTIARAGALLAALALGGAIIGLPLLISLPQRSPAGADAAGESPSLATASPSAVWSPTADLGSPSGSEVPVPLVGATSAVQAGGDPSWYQSIAITYDQTLPAGQKGHLEAANLGRAQCEGVLVFAAYGVNQWLGLTNNYGEDPETFEFAAPEIYIGTFDLQMTCFSAGLNSGYSHTWHLPVKVGPPLPWTISVSMSNTKNPAGNPQTLFVNFTVDAHGGAVWSDGTCDFAAQLPDGSTRTVPNLNWYDGRQEEYHLQLPVDPQPGQLTWSLSCRDQEISGGSVSGTYELSFGATNPPTETPAPPEPTPTPEPTPEPTPTPAGDGSGS